MKEGLENLVGGSAKEKSNSIKDVLFMSVIVFIIMTVCSESSFLYPFNNEADVSCFYTVARCLRKGFILYKDIYEHKGLYLYAIYMIASIIKCQNYIGIYLIEVLFAWIYMGAAYYSVIKLTNSRKLSVVVTIATLLLTYTSPGMQEGGFAEEFITPLIAICIYFSIRYCYDYEKKGWPLSYVFIIGVISSLIFWIKYTGLGSVAGLIIFVFVSLIKKRNIKMLMLYSGVYLLGFSVGSMPAIIYFSLNNAFRDLFQVYFYNLIMVYGKTKANNIPLVGKILCSFADVNFTHMIFMNSSLLALMFIGMIYAYKKNNNHNLVSAINYMFVFSAISLSAGILYDDCYQPLVIMPFLIFPIISIIKFAGKIKKETVNEYVGQLKKLQKYKNIIVTTVFCVTLILYTLGYIKTPYSVILLFIYMYIIYSLGQKVVNIEAVYKKYDGNKYIIKYMVPAVVLIVSSIIDIKFTVETNYFKCASLIVLMMYVVCDWDKINIFIYDKVDQLVIFIKKLWNGKWRLWVSVMSFGALIAMANNIGYMTWKYEDVPNYKIAEYIKNSGIDNPIIYHYNFIDSGVYNMLDTYPQMKYYGYYYIDLPEIDETIDEYVVNRKSDFIITNTHNPGELVNEGYKMVYWGINYINCGDMSLCLYERIK